MLEPAKQVSDENMDADKRILVLVVRVSPQNVVFEREKHFLQSLDADFRVTRAYNENSPMTTDQRYLDVSTYPDSSAQRCLKEVSSPLKLFCNRKKQEN